MKRLLDLSKRSRSDHSATLIRQLYRYTIKPVVQLTHTKG